jgi:hypothetical protein
MRNTVKMIRWVVYRNSPQLTEHLAALDGLIQSKSRPGIRTSQYYNISAFIPRVDCGFDSVIRLLTVDHLFAFGVTAAFRCELARRGYS